MGKGIATALSSAFVIAALLPFQTAELEAKPPVSRPSASRLRVVCDRLVEDFRSSATGEFPRGWRTRDADEMPFAKAHALYTVEQVGPVRALRARYKQEAITIGRPVENWDLAEYPYLQWKWKAVQLPQGADERSLSTNDSAASVYVIWDIGFPFYVDGIRYSWSSTQPVGTRVARRFGHDQILVVEGASRHRGTWTTERVNVRDDHRAFFERKDSRRPSAIALLTDADATSSRAEALYTDFRLCREVRGPPKP